MAFKLGSKRGNSDKKLNFRGTSDDYVAGVVIEHCPLPEGIMGETHKEGVIKINSNIPKNSEEYRRVLQHEMKHMTHMKLGKVDYDNNCVMYDGQAYPRKDGYILYEGQWLEEGSTEFPWEFKD
jgi:hypothetical protein